MAGNLIQITDAGRAALVAAGNTGTVARRVVEIGIGTAAFLFDKGMTALPNERKRVTTFGGENVAPDTVHVVIQDDSDDQYSLYAFGLYLDNGVLFGVYVQRTPILEKSPAAMLLLASDVVFASIDAAQLQFGPATFLNPPATTERKGVVELATQAEVDDGADDTRAVTPKSAAKRYAALAGAKFTGPVIIDSATDDGASALQVAGRIAVNHAIGEGQIALGKNDGHFYGNENGVGFSSSTQGRFQYVFADRTFRINDKTAWHEGNLDPLDKTKGGTMAADLAFAPDKRLALADGSRGSPSLTFASDRDTGLYHTGDGGFDIACNGQAVLRFAPSLAAFDQAVTAPTPPAGDRSTRLATTEWVLAALSTTAIGQVVFEIRSTVRAGFLKANGAVVSRADYPALWAYAQASGALVSDADWGNRRWGCFGMGDGSTTFRLPELRGEFLRCWDDTRGIDSNRQIGSQQDAANLWHSHGASASAGGDHVHPAWTDAQGNHQHHGSTVGAGEHQHVVPFGQHQNSFTPPWGTDGDNNRFGAQSEDWDNKWFLTSPSGGHAHEFWSDWNGNHGHNIGVGWAGNHTHNITVNADGANEARPRNVALLAMIRAY
ncbi:phage tail protein [Burkholderia stagnalis]|uniref:phage tail protein n=1 Tax=Burkholderia stagnalis TaxID=1503054 RepID=UPI000F57BA98|nr:phage tail protein [Burkholderia stagnalis]RQQ73129.1 phage tail protein [Burkholderia stagnalis]RQQ74583.1 phage tail protein [Burkholderia stagnalis]RQQ86775.1 phage tail protein [Burkholderia stagnalis]RQQ95483.1 phage tail protein [Burkholderia stagnalis]